MKFTDKSLAEEEWYKIYGDWPNGSDFAWPFFRDAFNAGRETVVESKKSFYEILRSKFLFSSEISDNIIDELKQWLSEIQTTGASDGRIDLSTIDRKSVV